MEEQSQSDPFLHRTLGDYTGGFHGKFTNNSQHRPWCDQFPYDFMQGGLDFIHSTFIVFIMCLALTKVLGVQLPIMHSLVVSDITYVNNARIHPKHFLHITSSNPNNTKRKILFTTH